MRAVLIMPPFPFDRRDKILPAGLAYLAAVTPPDIELSVINGDVDEDSDKRFVRRVAEVDAEMLLFTAHTYQVPAVERAAAAAKLRNPRIVTVLGGPHAGEIPEETLRRCPSLDIAAVGEGEETIVDLYRAFREGGDWSGVAGIAYRAADAIRRNPDRSEAADVDALPFPKWDAFDLPRYRPFYPLPDTSFPLLTSRGCPYPCRFCSRALGDAVRDRSIESVRGEIESVLAMGYRSFHITDETFTLKRRRTLALCEELARIAREHPIAWVTQTRVDRLDMEILKLMKEGGCVSINFGIESGDQELLDSMGKRIELADAVRVLDMCRQVGMHNSVNFILGCPGETRRTLRVTQQFVRRIDTHQLAVSQLVAFPGTDYHRMAVAGENGVRLVSDDWERMHPQFKSNLKVPGVKQRQLAWAQFFMYFQFYVLGAKRRVLWRLLSPRAIGQYTVQMLRSIVGA